MILSARIMIYGLIIILLSTYVMAWCQWTNENNRYCRRHSNINEINCISTVSYDLMPCENDNGIILYDYNIKINLENPDENPFLENISFYSELKIQDGYLVTVPKDVFNMTKLTDVTILGNKLRKINFNDFLPLLSLKRINLASNKIIVIETNSEAEIYSAVQEIDVSFNFIEAVPNNFVKRFSELEHLNMSHNLISSIGKHAFEGTVQLKTLDLSFNRLQEVGNIFAQLPRLVDSNYAISENLQKLSKLVVDNNLIAKINFTEFFETGVPELSIGGNQISCNELARVRYSKYSEKFGRIVTANILNFIPEYINGISCQEARNDVTDVINVSDNSNSSILVSLLKNAIENNSKSVDTVIETVNQNEKKLEQFIASTKSMLLNIDTQLRYIKNNLLDKHNTTDPSDLGSNLEEETGQNNDYM